MRTERRASTSARSISHMRVVHSIVALVVLGAMLVLAAAHAANSFRSYLFVGL